MAKRKKEREAAKPQPQTLATQSQILFTITVVAFAILVACFGFQGAEHHKVEIYKVNEPRQVNESLSADEDEDEAGECVASPNGCPDLPLPVAESGTPLADTVEKYHHATQLYKLALRCEAGEVTGESCTFVDLGDVPSVTLAVMLMDILLRMDTVYNTSAARSRVFYACKYNQWAVGSLETLRDHSRQLAISRLHQCQQQLQAFRVQELHHKQLGGKKPPPQERMEIPRRHALSYKEFYTEYASKSLPVVITVPENRT